MSADEALAQQAGQGEGAKDRAWAVEWLAGVLADAQEHPVKAVKGAAQNAGLAWRTVQRAATALGVQRRRAGFGGDGVWHLHGSGAPIDANPVCNETSGTDGTNGTDAENPGNPGDPDLPERHPCQVEGLGTNGVGQAHHGGGGEQGQGDP